jgi:biopolymer transport protein ExbB/TolQ
VVGTLIAVISSLCYVATWEVIYFKFVPNFAAKLEAYNIDRARKSAASPAEIEQKVAEAKRFTERYQNPLFNSAITFLEPMPVGLLIALVSAGLLRRRRSRDANGALATSMS